MIRAGADDRKKMTASAVDTNIPVIGEGLLIEGVLIDEGGHLPFVKDCVFSSPSSAAEAVLSRCQSGPEALRDGYGITLK